MCLKIKRLSTEKFAVKKGKRILCVCATYREALSNLLEYNDFKQEEEKELDNLIFFEQHFRNKVEEEEEEFKKAA